MSEIGRADHERLRKPRKLIRLLRTARYRRALRLGVAAATEHEKVPFGHRFRTVIDVGSHKGQFALFAHEQFAGSALICVEPLEAEGKLLRRVVGDAATIIPVAAGAHAARMDLHVARASDSSSLLPITPNCTAAFDGAEEIETVPVDVRPLDEVIAADGIERPALLKIDVQGGERGVLRGAPRLLQVIDEAYIECSFVELYEGQALADEIVLHMHEHGLRLTGLYGVVRDGSGRTLQADLLFSRQVIRGRAAPA